MHHQLRCHAGCKIKEYPREGIINLVAQQAADNLKIVKHSVANGSLIEIGKRAALGSPDVDYMAPFDIEKGNVAFESINLVWQHKRPKPEDS